MQIGEASEEEMPVFLPEAESMPADPGFAASISFSPVSFVTKALTSWMFGFIGLVPGNERLQYHTSLFWRQMDHSFSPDAKPWWNPIVEGVYLGALPLSNWGHIQQLKDECQITAVLSLNQDLELNSSGIWSVPVSFDEWNEAGIDFLQISSEDFRPPTLDNIIQGVAFIKAKVDEGKKIYVHCKAGRGRSAIVVICYLIRHHGMSVQEAFSYVKERRPQINMNREQLESISFYSEHCESIADID